MTKRITSLYMDDSCTRLMVASRNGIERCAEVPTGQSRGNTPADAAETGNRLKQFLKSERIPSKNVVVGLSGLHCHIRLLALPHLPPAILKEAVTREAQRVLPVPLDQVHLTWQTVPAPKDKTSVLLVAVPRRVVEAAVKVLRHAGVKPRRIELKPLAIARVLREKTAVAVDIQSTEFDIVIVSDGIPQLVRTVLFPDTDEPRKEQLLRDELGRTMQFYAANNPGSPPVSQTPAFVSGRIAPGSEMERSLQSIFGSAPAALASPLPSAADAADGFDPALYMVNVGLALKELEGKGERHLRMDLDALPAEYRTRAISPARIAILPGAAAVAIPLLVLTANMQITSNDIALMRKQEVLASRFLVEKQGQRREIAASIADMEKKVARLDRSYSTFSAALDSLTGQRRKLNAEMAAAWQSAPGISLSEVSDGEGSMTIRGRAASLSDVLQYAKRLENSGLFSSVTVASARAADGAVQFNLSLKSAK